MEIKSRNGFSGERERERECLRPPIKLAPLVITMLRLLIEEIIQQHRAVLKCQNVDAPHAMISRNANGLSISLIDVIPSAAFPDEHIASIAN